MAHVTFIHGIANKPPLAVLLKIWSDALAGAGLDLGAEGTSASMIYWADVLYPEPVAKGPAEGAPRGEAATGRGATNPVDPNPVDPNPVDLDLGAMDADEQRWVQALALRQLAVPLAAEDGVESPPIHVQGPRERIPLPWPLKKRIMKKLLRDVHHYLFNVEFTPKAGTTYKVQDEIRRRVVRALAAGAGKPGPHVLVSHSMGTVIAYDCLKRVRECPPIDGLMTIGGPLGLEEIQDKLKPEWSRDDGFAHEKLRGGWVNVWDRLDPVCGFDPNFANDYRRGGERIIADVQVHNPGSWKHDISKYLAQPALVDGLRGLLHL